MTIEERVSTLERKNRRLTRALLGESAVIMVALLCGAGANATYDSITVNEIFVKSALTVGDQRDPKDSKKARNAVDIQIGSTPQGTKAFVIVKDSSGDTMTLTGGGEDRHGSIVSLDHERGQYKGLRHVAWGEQR